MVGGWKIDQLMKSDPQPQTGLLEEANGSMLYIDEVNLLDDHIVNLILDVTSTGFLSVQRDGLDFTRKEISFALVGTMNPEEGQLRPQLLDRFGLMVDMKASASDAERAKILRAVLGLDEAMRPGGPDGFMQEGWEDDLAYRDDVLAAKQAVAELKPSDEVLKACLALSRAFKAVGHRGEFVLAMAARALAARTGATEVTKEHVQRVARMALQHRRPEALQSDHAGWGETEDETVRTTLGLA